MSLATRVDALATRAAQEVKGKLPKIYTSGSFKHARSAHIFQSNSTGLAGDLFVMTKIPLADHMVTLHITGMTAGQGQLDTRVTFYARADGTTIENPVVTDLGDLKVTQVKVMKETATNLIAVSLVSATALWHRPKITVDALVGQVLLADAALAGWQSTVTTDYSLHTVLSTITTINRPEPNPVLATQAEAEAGTITTPLAWSAERIRQAITALGLIPEIGDLKTSMKPADHGVWMFCDGREVSRTGIYAAFATVMYDGAGNYRAGNGNGISTLNLPDLRSRTPLGAGASTPLGSSDGVASEATRRSRLTHSHTVGPVTTNTSGSGHTHEQTSSTHNRGTNMTTGGSGVYLWDTVGGATHNHTIATTGSGHTHGVIGNTDANSTPPHQAVNYFIRVI